MTWTINGTPELDRISNYRLVVSVCLACSCCMSIVVALRAWVRIRWVKAIGMDDWLLWIAAACAITNSALTLTQSRLGLSLPLALRPKPNLAIYTIHNFVNRFVYIFATTFFKLSLCSAYMRMIHTTTYKDYRIAVWVATGITVGFGISYFFAILFACAPVAKSWNPSLAGKCFPVAPFYYGTSIINCCIDLMLFLLPIPLLWRLQMNKRKQIGLSLAFGLGTFTTVCSIMRSYSVGKILKSGNTIDFVLWSTVEINVGVSSSSSGPLQRLS
ncbi:hypothetical protein KVT40_006281 [Elsinoe batatas]|uniref:Rhodopsin domain-containing protein n=1 Tax=Elsinoe batatas TaxID=2601811 RepID=A0A8K0KYZ4_9PEZI|nr:hypothetical protein KVT40_006281 [Elsinoe batatas]